MKKSLLVILILLLSSTLLFAEDLSKYLPDLNEDEQSILLSGEMLTALSTWEQSVLRLSPNGSFSSEFAKNAANRTKGFAVATLRYIPYPDTFKNQTPEERLLFLFNTLRSISTQKGLTYISHLEGDKETTLIQDTYLIGNKKDKYSRIEDPVSDTVPTEYSCYSYQKDNRFGDNVYQLDYKTDDNEVFLQITNYTKMKYLGITCLKPGELHIYMNVIQTEEGFILYSLAESEDREPTITVIAISVDLPSSFCKRITSLGDWFENKVEKTN